jgi:hypothetical protein
MVSKTKNILEDVSGDIDEILEDTESTHQKINLLIALWVVDKLVMFLIIYFSMDLCL